MLGLVWTLDHRYIDGAMAVKFLRQVKEMVENPVKMEDML